MPSDSNLKANNRHILNGDALYDQFPDDWKDQCIIVRECLMEGPVKASGLEELYKIRSAYLDSTYGEITHLNYEEDVISEFNKIQRIQPTDEIFLWFEDDLFCQVNFWFISHLLCTKRRTGNSFLIRPDRASQYGFGGYSRRQLRGLFQHKKPIKDLSVFAALWSSYQEGDFDALLEKAMKMQEDYPFVLPAVKAQLTRIPVNGDKGQPEIALREIMLRQGSDNFGEIFKSFCREYPIYGFGDLQIKRIFEEIRDNEI